MGSSTVHLLLHQHRQHDTGDGSVMADVVNGGGPPGQRRPRDGIDGGCDTYMSNVGVMPTEVVETNYSVRVLKTEFIAASQGWEHHNGGLGLRREYQIIDSPPNGSRSFAKIQGADFAPRGAAGGGDDRSTTKVTVIGPDGRRDDGLPPRRLRSRCNREPSCGSRPQAAGDTVPPTSAPYRCAPGMRRTADSDPVAIA